MAGRGPGLDKGVVPLDALKLDICDDCRNEQQPEAVAGAEPGGDEAPVGGDFGLGGGVRWGGEQAGERDEEDGKGAQSARGPRDGTGVSGSA